MPARNTATGAVPFDSHTFCKVIVRPNADLLRDGGPDLIVLCGEYLVTLPDDTPADHVGSQAVAVVEKHLLATGLNARAWDLSLGATDMRGEAIHIQGSGQVPRDWNCEHVPPDVVAGRPLCESTAWKAPGLYGVDPADIAMLTVALYRTWAECSVNWASERDVDNITRAEQICLLAVETAAYLNEIVDFEEFAGVFYYEHVDTPNGGICHDLLRDGFPQTVDDLRRRAHEYLIAEGIDLVTDSPESLSMG